MPVLWFCITSVMIFDDFDSEFKAQISNKTRGVASHHGAFYALFFCFSVKAKTTGLLNCADCACLRSRQYLVHHWIVTSCNVAKSYSSNDACTMNSLHQFLTHSRTLYILRPLRLFLRNLGGSYSPIQAWTVRLICNFNPWESYLTFLTVPIN
jgi:hypothetical protein